MSFKVDGSRAGGSRTRVRVASGARLPIPVRVAVLARLAVRVRFATQVLGSFALLPGLAAAQDSQELAEVVVTTGVRASEAAAVELKREAQLIQDSISAEDIGKLPDTTISDSLQRITGVQ